MTALVTESKVVFGLEGFCLDDIFCEFLMELIIKSLKELGIYATSQGRRGGLVYFRNLKLLE